MSVCRPGRARGYAVCFWRFWRSGRDGCGRAGDPPCHWGGTYVLEVCLYIFSCSLQSLNRFGKNTGECHVPHQCLEKFLIKKTQGWRCWKIPFRGLPTWVPEHCNRTGAVLALCCTIRPLYSALYGTVATRIRTPFHASGEVYMDQEYLQEMNNFKPILSSVLEKKKPNPFRCYGSTQHYRRPAFIRPAKPRLGRDSSRLSSNKSPHNKQFPVQHKPKHHHKKKKINKPLTHSHPHHHNHTPISLA